MTAVAAWWVNTGSVETYQGDGPYGPVFAAAKDVACWVEGGAKLVRNAQGDEVTSMTRVYGPTSLAPLFTPGSRFTYAGNTSLVLWSTVHDSGSLGLGVDHVEVALT